MIEELWLSFHASGDAFRPSRIQFPFSEQHDPGELARRGRFKGGPYPHGYCEIEAPDDLPIDDKIPFLCREVARILPAMRAAGADQFHISAGYLWREQCNLEFSPSDMKLIADLGVSFCVSCYENREEEERQGEPGATDNPDDAQRLREDH